MLDETDKNFERRDDQADEEEFVAFGDELFGSQPPQSKNGPAPFRISPVSKPVDSKPAVEKPLIPNPVEKPVAPKPIEKAVEKPVTPKPLEKTAEKPPAPKQTIPSPFRILPEKPVITKPNEKAGEKPVAPKPIEKAGEKPVAPKPIEKAGEKPVAPKPSEKSAEKPSEKPVDLSAGIPAQARDAGARAMAALQRVQPGKPIAPEVRQIFEQAVRDGQSIDPAWASRTESQLTAELESRPRRLPSGLVLPPWTQQQERRMWENVARTEQALQAVPEPLRARMTELDAQIRSLPADAHLRRTQLQATMTQEAGTDATGKANLYLAARTLMDSFMRDNQMGLIRRNLHQQEVGQLHARSITAAMYAMALDRAGQPADRPAIETQLRTVAADEFTRTNIPEVGQLMERYAVRETDPLDGRIPGRAALRQAIQIMADERQGTTAQRMERARPLFEQAIGASSEINIGRADDELKNLMAERNRLNPDRDQARREEIDSRAVELLETIRQPGTARLSYAMALNNTGVATNDNALRERALAILRSMETVDPGSRFDPVVQGAIALAQGEPRLITLENAQQTGGPIAERLQREHAEEFASLQGQQAPLWQQILRFGGEAAVGLVGFYALSYAFKPAGAAYRYTMRNWEARSRANSAQIDAGLPAGSQPRLFLRDAQGREVAVEGVRWEDGRLRVRNGEQLEITKPNGTLVVRVPEGTSEQDARRAARQLLNPTTAEEALGEVQRQYQRQLDNLQREVIQRHQAEVQAAAGGQPPARTTEIELGGRRYTVAGTHGEQHTILHDRTASGEAVAEAITRTDLEARFEQVRVNQNGSEEIRYMEKGRPERGLFQLRSLGGELLLAADPTLRVVPNTEVASATRIAPQTVHTSPAPAAERTGGGSTPPPPKPTERPAPELPRPLPAGALVRSELVVNRDGTVRFEDIRVGESMTVERLSRLTQLDAEHVRFLEQQAERLKNSTNPEERAQGERLAETARALKGEYGEAARLAAHRGILERSRVELERRRGSGLRTGAAVGLAILASAAIGWYLSEATRPESPLQRARIRGSQQP